MQEKANNRELTLLLSVGLSLQLLVYILQPDIWTSFVGWITIISGLVGVCSVVLCSQGRIITFAFGFVQILTYMYLCWIEHLWAEVGMNIFYLLSQFYGIYVWRKRLEQEVLPRSLSTKMMLLLSLGTLVLSALVGWGLAAFTNDSQPWLDAFSAVPAIIAQVLLVLAYREQWFLWLFVDILTMILWIIAGNYALAALYLFWCINCLVGLKNWKTSC